MTMDELAQLARNEQMIPKAPIQATHSVRIAASLHNVWSILTNVSEWERWYPYLQNARLLGPFSAQTRLTYGGWIQHKLRLAKVVPEELVMLYGTMAGYQGITRWNVKQVGTNHTEVSFTESSSGFLISALYSNQKLGEHLQCWLEALKNKAETPYKS